MKSLFITLALVLCFQFIVWGSAQAQEFPGIGLGWEDPNDPPCDYYILYRSEHPDTGFLVWDFITPLQGTNIYMTVDTTAVEGVPYFYRIAAVRDLDHSSLSPWSRALWHDKTGGAYTYLAAEYWNGGDLTNMLVVYTPIADCDLVWRFIYPTGDLIAVKCAPFSGVVPPINLTPQERP